MNRALNRAITQMIQDCPAAAHVIQVELKRLREEVNRRIEVVRCRECEKQANCKHGQYLGDNGFCSYGERKE